MNNKLPRWVCRSKADIERFTQWTIEQLDTFYAGAEGPPDRTEEWLRANPAAREEYERAVSMAASYQAEVAVDKAIKTKNYAPLESLPDNLTRAALKQLFQRAYGPNKKRGRRKGDPRPTDRDLITRVRLHDAAEEIPVIKMIWKENFNKVNRGRDNKPHVRDIAAKYGGVTREELDKYMKEKRGRVGPRFNPLIRTLLR
jgi:hypothetical protein